MQLKTYKHRCPHQMQPLEPMASRAAYSSFLALWAFFHWQCVPN